MGLKFPEEFEKSIAERTGVGLWRISLLTVEMVDERAELTWRGGDEKRRELHEIVAESCLQFHATAAADLSELAHATDLSDTLSELRSVLAVPVFDPDVFHPDPSFRPILAIVTLASSLEAKELLEVRTDVQIIAEGTAKEIVKSAFNPS